MTGLLAFKAKPIGLSILGGLIAGGMLASIQLVLVRPYVDALSGDWLNFQTANGQFDEDLFNQQMQSIYTTNLLFSLIIGLAGGALLGVIFALGGEHARRSLVRSGIISGALLWFVLCAVPGVKYPPDPVATFDPDQAGGYNFFSTCFVALSGASAVVSVVILRKSSRKTKWFGAGALYLACIALMSVIFPDVTHTDQPFNQTVVLAWRAASSIAYLAFWMALGLIAGLLSRDDIPERLVHRQAER